MIFVTGPRYAGKKTYIRNALGWTEEELAARAVQEAQELAGPETDLTALADMLAVHAVVIASETGCGVVPMDAEERARREAAGRLACLLAARADVVIRLCCGIPEYLKGKL